MKKYWLIPALAIIAITTSMVYSMASIEKPTSVDGKVIFIDGTTISDLSYQPTDTEDKHKVVFFKLAPGTQAGLIFAIHLNDSNQKILINAGDFPLAKYCQGGKVLECRFPIPDKALEQSETLGIAAYAIPGQLIQIQEGRADWDDHRAIFPTR
ncbi:hypothetical protein [Pseudomonas atacamensis]|jgi:hypothetical protein|uniref:hypothetical protein n=1 Tax=Pseudomonas atacamensis TaxID=2565368 RepID=UPI000F4A4EA6|nr:hypothetical protein [Pseudomonas atacamensis]MDT6917593.1 hypothetical protein [Pseudomonas atacamensis]RON70019.1 hypothetical protein BK677_18915 [Pseudomonas fluorescens]ROO07337.1 hypothetical protein BK675_13260 [Pseudomonas fluorescens]ROO18470.1 hypothetical protein BK676_07510 [Pseudomonas fluorescens]